MFTKHPYLTEPENPRQRLWRYLKNERMLGLINEGNLYFPHITRMTDKWEGLLTKRTEEKLFWTEYANYNNAESAKASIKQYEEHKDAFYVNCWHMNMHESYLMWKVYGDRGCAIQTTYERIVTSFHNTPAEINGGIVNYIDYEREQFPLGNTFWSVSHKDLPYKDEREFRLFYWKLSLPNQNLPVEETGVKVAVDADILIENIYTNPATLFDADKLVEAINEKSLSCEIKKSRIRE